LALDNIITGKKPQPRRALLYGVQGIGKSTWASKAPEPIFVPTEDGLGEIGAARFPVATTLEEAMQALSDLCAEEHSFQTVVVDSLDWLEKLIWAQVCEDKNVENIDDIGYAKGYSYAVKYWREFLAALSWLRENKGMTVVLLAHSVIQKFEDPEAEAYDRFSPRLHKHAVAIVCEWCDEVLFAKFKVLTQTEDKGFNKKRARGLGTGQRIVRTEERPAHAAKNRLGLPFEMNLDWSEYASHFTTNGKTKASK